MVEEGLAMSAREKASVRAESLDAGHMGKAEDEEEKIKEEKVSV